MKVWGIYTEASRYSQEQVAKSRGLVKFREQWVTKEERFILEQKARGLVEYKGDWITKEEMFENKQKEKGLVYYQGEWLRFEEAQSRKGLVKYNKMWYTLDEKERIIKLEQTKILEEKRHIEESRNKVIFVSVLMLSLAFIIVGYLKYRSRK